MILQPISMLDTEKVLLHVAPLNADGSPDTAAVISWESSDASVTLEVQPDTQSCFVLTPLTSGSGTVKASSPGYESDSVDIVYSAATGGRALNLSADAPISDFV